MSDNSPDKLIKLSPSGKQFFTLPNTSLLESGLGSGVALPYNCANGSCGECRAKVLAGQVRKIRFHDFTLTESEKLGSVCLLCANTAETDLVIEVAEAKTVDDIPQQQQRAKLCHIEKLPEISIVRFKLTRGKALRFLPGQYATITHQTGASISLPIANCPCEPDYLEFHIPAVNNSHSNNSFSIEQLKNRERVTIEGPHGRFTIDENRLRPQHANPHPKAKLFIATAEAFAAIKPLLELVISLETDIPCTLVWIASETISLYQHNLCRSWSDAFHCITYKPLTSIDTFTIAELQSWELPLPDMEIYISGPLSHSLQVSSVLAALGVAPDAITTDTTLHNR